MVGEVDTVSPTFSNARTVLFWIGGFFFIFVTIAVMATVFDQMNNTSSARSPESNPARRPAGRPGAEPSISLTPETAAPPR